MKSKTTKQEWFLGIVAFVLTGALWRVFSTGNEASLDGDSRTQIILALLYSAVMCLAVLIIAPSHGMAADFGSGAARGIFTHKNLFGAAMALGFLVEWHLPDENSLARAFKLGSLCLYTVLLVLSHSATSIVTVAST